jgi:hypothetical protein
MKIIPTCVLLLWVLTPSLGAETRTQEGTLVDQKCLSYYRETQPEKLQDHSRACVLACGRESGYGVIAGSAYFLLDAEGRKLAQTWLEASSKEKDLRVKVTIVDEGGKSKVVKIE